MGHGVVSCLQSEQIMYSLSAGLSAGNHDTQYYKGNIVAIDGDGDDESGTMYTSNGQVQVGATELEGMKVAHMSKVEGPPRWLHWPIMASAGTAAQVAGLPLAQVAAMGYNLGRYLVWADAYRMVFEGAGGAVDDLLVSLLVATQDLHRDRVTFFHNAAAVGTVYGLAAAGAGAAAAGAGAEVVSAAAEAVSAR